VVRGSEEGGLNDGTGSDKLKLKVGVELGAQGWGKKGDRQGGVGFVCWD